MHCFVLSSSTIIVTWLENFPLRHLTTLPSRTHKAMIEGTSFVNRKVPNHLADIIYRSVYVIIVMKVELRMNLLVELLKMNEERKECTTIITNGNSGQLDFPRNAPDFNITQRGSTCHALVRYYCIIVMMIVKRNFGKHFIIHDL